MAERAALLLSGGLAALQDFHVARAPPDQRAAVCSVDGVRLIVQHLQAASDAQHIEHLCRILVDVFQEDPELRSEGQLLAPLLARWMQEFGSVTVSRRLLGLTVELGASYRGGDIARPHVLQQGAAAAIVSILQKHLHDPNQLDQDLAMATLLCGRSPSTPSSEAPVDHQYLVDAKLPEVLIQIIEMHAALPDILVHSLTALFLLSGALRDAFQDAMYAERIATAVAAAMAAHEGVGELQLPASLLLNQLTEACQETVEVLVEQLGVAVLQKVAEHHAEDHALVRSLVKLVARISKDAEHQKWCAAVRAGLPADAEEEGDEEDRYSDDAPGSEDEKLGSSRSSRRSAASTDSRRKQTRAADDTPRSSQPYTASSQPPRGETPRSTQSSSQSPAGGDTPRSVEELLEGCDPELDRLYQAVADAPSPKGQDRKWRALVRELYAQLKAAKAEADAAAQAARLQATFATAEAQLRQQETDIAIKVAQMEAERNDLQSRLKGVEGAEADVQRRLEAVWQAEARLAEDYSRSEAALQDMLEKQRVAKQDLAEVARERQELTDLRLKFSAERSEVERQRKATEAKEAQMQEAQRKVEEQLGDMEWREKSIVNKEKEGAAREQNLDRRDAETKKREKAFQDKHREQEARERQQVLKERELSSMMKDLERREIATRERVRMCDLREEAMEERARDLAAREAACQALQEELAGREEQMEREGRDLQQREATVADLAEEVRQRKEQVDQRESAVTAREKAQKEQKKELREAKQKVQKREDEVMEWIKELQWREYDFQKREEGDRSPLAPAGAGAKVHKETFGESLISVQLGRLKDAYITSKERMLRQRVRPAPDVGRRTRDIVWQVKDYSVMKAMSYEVKERSTDFRRMMARLRGLELDPDSCDEQVFHPEEVAELRRIAASENDLSDEASFTLQVLACPMNDRHMFSSDTEVVLALEEWWIDTRDRVHERYMGILRRRRQQLDHAMDILAKKRDAVPNLWVKRDVDAPISPEAKKNGGLIFSATFPVGHSTLKPIPDKWRHPYSKVEVKKPPYGRLPPPRPQQRSPGRRPPKRPAPKRPAADTPHSEEEVFGPESSDAEVAKPPPAATALCNESSRSTKSSSKNGQNSKPEPAVKDAPSTARSASAEPGPDSARSHSSSKAESDEEEDKEDEDEKGSESGSTSYEDED